MSPTDAAPDDTSAAAQRLWLLGLSVVAVITGAFLRVRATLGLEGFSWDHPEGLLKSDPGLLYYVARRIVEAGGLAPPDLRADPRIEWPLTTDYAAIETIGQEFLVAWAQLSFGQDVPLHVTSMIVMSLTASMAAVGVIGLAWELTREVRWSALAAVLFVICLANYRTVGFLLIREDLSLPLFALHLYLFARAARVRTPASVALAALSFTAAVATWHAMQFVATIEAGCLFGWLLVRGDNPLRGITARVLPAIFLLGCLAVPALLSKRTYVSPLGCLVLAMCLAALVAERVPAAAQHPRRAVLAALVPLLLLGRFAGSAKDYSHVYGFMLQKVLRLGAMPVDPSALDFEARLLWQGPFSSATPADLAYSLGPLAVLPLAALLLLAREWREREGDVRLALLGAFGAASIGCALLVERLGTLLGLCAPVLAVLFLRALPQRAARALVIVLVVTQGIVFTDMLGQRKLTSWYRAQDLPVMAGAVDFINRSLDPRGAVVSDFATSTILLAHTRHATVVQPKYETLRSRQRIEQLLSAFYSGTPRDLHALITGPFRARYFLLDAHAMWSLRYAGGLPVANAIPAPGSAADAFFSSRPERYAHIPGFALLYEAPQGDSWLRIYEALR